MSYTLTFARKPRYLHATVVGQNGKEAVAGYLEEIRIECVASGVARVLIEERLVGPRLGPADVFDIAAAGSSRTSGVFQAIAYVDVNADGAMMKFAETVAVNRGVPIRLFSTVADAEQWLLGGAGG
ncbi:MAG: hypothetical protein ACREBN_11655 [Burkholderiaceae bacterium]